jgi:hypothetical protein
MGKKGWVEILTLFCWEYGQSLTELTLTQTAATSGPITFVNNRYKVIQKLGEGSKKKV